MSESGSEVGGGYGGHNGFGSTRSHFPGTRLLYAIGFGLIAWFVFWITVVIAVVQFVVLAVNGRVNEELRTFSINLIQYLWELTAFVTFVRDEQPFPVGPFPKRR